MFIWGFNSFFFCIVDRLLRCKPTEREWTIISFSQSINMTSKSIFIDAITEKSFPIGAFFCGSVASNQFQFQTFYCCDSKSINSIRNPRLQLNTTISALRIDACEQSPVCTINKQLHDMLKFHSLLLHPLTLCRDNANFHRFIWASTCCCKSCCVHPLYLLSQVLNNNINSQDRET